MISEKRWYVYMLQCKDGSLYTGITDDIQKRLDAHRSGKGAKYTRGRGPLTLKYLEIYESKGDALRREIVIKALKPEKKRAMISPEDISSFV